MVHFVGAGPGDPELITKKGARLLSESDVVIYAGSLVNPKLLELCKKEAKIYNSATMTLDEVLNVMYDAEEKNLTTVRLHTGDPAIYGAIAEQMDALNEKQIVYDVIPGVSSFLGAAASLKKEYTLPGISQTVIITRQGGRTPVPESESLKKLAAHNSTMCIFLSVHKIDEVVNELIEGGYKKETPVAVVEKATWEDEQILWGNLENIAEKVHNAKIAKTAMIVVSPCLDATYEPSRLYAPDFSHMFREAKV
ncbi:MAG: precorrin-4 C(11)-methyltransferase [Selenomonadaceae bacterium]|nr:precorrin-4 C(11)-methyltransferase [Selenomonadaceae bacterium]